MKRTPVVSSNLRSVGYEPESQVLEIEFRGGWVYLYFGVPEDIYDGLMGASSHGTYHDRYIKHSYPFQRAA